MTARQPRFLTFWRLAERDGILHRAWRDGENIGRRFTPSSGWTPFTIKSVMRVVTRVKPFTVVRLHQHLFPFRPGWLHTPGQTGKLNNPGHPIGRSAKPLPDFTGRQLTIVLFHKRNFIDRPLYPVISGGSLFI
ncbi:hypothetical protein SARI_02708 [Salmonella enterica subsp. arizonae serovar 62:z4,z23:-]|uniref:Uncharacterized protein n=1 Tax=Salmonella arizonae (strain ATCC BAA-731 / CDC346-86 / RSK2980) TaxID=41514 RepID=A9MNT2_SALAR|nr:hypothetical protein SARI_02708 [Salmonella enterica subsp. arizonae serovar 62:z4,z23:-]